MAKTVIFLKGMTKDLHIQERANYRINKWFTTIKRKH